MELSGDESSSKTEILLHLMINTIIPKTSDSQTYSVVFIDTEYSFPMTRFINLLEQRLINSNKQQAGISAEEFVKNCLQRIFKVNCSSSLELLVTTHSFNTFVKSNPDIALVIINNIGAYQWIDDLAAENGKKHEHFSEIFKTLSYLYTEHGINIVVTKLDNFPTSYDTAKKPFSILRYFLEKQSSGDCRYSVAKLHGRKKSVVLNFQLTPQGIKFTE